MRTVSNSANRFEDSSSPSTQQDDCVDCPEMNKSEFHNVCRTTGLHGRSLSHDRRRAESAQFFEAVGELSLGTQEIEIVDTGLDDSPEDEGEGAYEIRSGQIPLMRNDLDYRGIGEADLEITKCGVQRGNCVTLHRKAWLEVSDSKHRYGKNLRVYYRHWASVGYPTNNFFHWLDCKGEAEGRALPDIEECPRKQLESETVLYINDKKITDSYSLSIVVDMVTRRAQILDAEGEPVTTGQEGWIFVYRDNALYGSRKVTALSVHSRQRFHHSSFFGGKAVSAAGILVTDNEGYLKEIHPHSGHYRPGEPDMQRCLYYLHSTGVGFDTFEVDMQQIFHVSRHSDSPLGVEQDVMKKKKQSCLFLRPASFAADFLAHKTKANKVGMFKQIESRGTTLLEWSYTDSASGGGSRILYHIPSPIQ